MTDVAAADARRIGLLGGSFDPVHLGHLLIAQDAMEQLNLDEVRFIPSPHAPLRENAPVAGSDDRVAMLDWATGSDEHFLVDTLEIDTHKTAYTVDTLERLHKRHPDERLFWILGADHIKKFSQWHEPQRLLELAEIIIVGRPGQQLEAPAGFDAARFHLVTGHPFEVSSSELRERIATGKAVRFFLPSGVAELIEERQLYRD